MSQTDPGRGAGQITAVTLSASLCWRSCSCLNVWPLIQKPLQSQHYAALGKWFHWVASVMIVAKWACYPELSGYQAQALKQTVQCSHCADRGTNRKLQKEKIVNSLISLISLIFTVSLDTVLTQTVPERRGKKIIEMRNLKMFHQALQYSVVWWPLLRNTFWYIN